LEVVDEATRRRFIMIPFVHKPAVPDGDLEQKLRKEYSGILRWMIGGCLDWQANGLVRPAVVTEATAEYFDEQDLLGQWISEKCECGHGRKAGATDLYNSWAAFSKEHGDFPGTSVTFAEALKARGFEKKKITGKMYYLGIALRDALDLQAMQE
jgi:putative DNA primase/helicase